MSKLQIALLTTGGDAPGMNAVIRSVVRTAHYFKMEVTGIRRGWRGLIEKDFMNLDQRSVSGIINRGGTMLHTERCPVFHQIKFRRIAAGNLKETAPGGLVVIGGNGSMQAAHALSKITKVPIVGIPASIDNDVAGTDETVGFDTAVNTALDAIDKIRDTATSHQRIFIVEVMGRENGFLAGSVGLASGAEFILVPEVKWKKEKLAAEISTFRKKGKTSSIIVMAEGAGSSESLAGYLEKKLKLPVRVSKLGYIQRGGTPTVDSRTLASIFGYEAVRLLRKRKGNRMLSCTGGKLASLPLSYPAAHKKPFDGYYLRVAKVLSQ